MAWCPICRTEYRDGITVCADCGAALVDILPELRDQSVVAYIEVGETELANKLIEFLGCSSIEAEAVYDEEQEALAIKVDTKKLAAAKTAYRAFAKSEYEDMTAKQIEALEKRVLLAKSSFKARGGEIEGEEPDDTDTELTDDEKLAIRNQILASQVYKPTEVYVSKEDESKDMLSTAITFLVFAVGLMIFMVLNAVGVFTTFSSLPSLILLSLLSIGCCLVGINAIHRSQRAAAASVGENKKTDAIEDWLNENITADLFYGLDYGDPGIEILYLKRTELIRSKLDEAFPGLDDNYADALVEKFYDKFFEENKETDSE